MRVPKCDYVVLVMALAAAVGSFGWYGWVGRAHGRTRRAAPFRGSPSTAYVAAKGDCSIPAPGKWLAPVAQTRGREWCYDVFTPPEIFYDAGTQQFAVSRPPASPETDAPGLELVAVERIPFRLQLVGYVGGAGRYLGTFENQVTGEVFLAGAGRTISSLELVIMEFAVERRPVVMADRLTSNQWVATASVRDQRTGETIRLMAGERSFTGELRALLAGDGDEDDTLLELRPGGEVRDAERSFVLERLQLDPPAAELTQTAPVAVAAPVHLTVKPPASSESLANSPAN